MAYNKYYLRLLGFVLILCTEILAAGYFMFGKPDLVYASFCWLLVIIQVMLLIRHLNKTNRALENFLTALEDTDTNLFFKDGSYPGSFRGLKDKIEKINKNFQEVKMENIRQGQLFKTVVDHAHAGLAVFNEQGEMNVLNNSFCNLLGIRSIRNLNDLKQVSPELYNRFSKEGETGHKTVKLLINNEIKQLAAVTARYKFYDQHFTLASIWDIRNELEANELESWQKLIRILTHEIMNSVGPIKSSIETMEELLDDGADHQDLTNFKSNIRKGIGIVKDRSVALSSFVQKFRTLTLFPTLTIEKVNVKQLVEDILYLIKTEIATTKIQIKLNVNPSNFTIMADKPMIQQVLINVLRNALEAFKEKNTESVKMLSIKGFLRFDGRKIIEIEDNGPGIDKEMLDSIFIPFFTTKKDGSGIGLSLSRQIMRQHQGNIHVTSYPDKGTTVSLLF